MTGVYAIAGFHMLFTTTRVFRGKDIDDAVSCALAAFGVGMSEWFRWWEGWQGDAWIFLRNDFIPTFRYWKPWSFVGKTDRKKHLMVGMICMAFNVQRHAKNYDRTRLFLGWHSQQDLGGCLENIFKYFTMKCKYDMDIIYILHHNRCV